MKKIIIAAFVLGLLGASIGVYAEEGVTSNKSLRLEKKEAVQDIKMAKKETIQNNRAEAKANKKAFRQEYKEKMKGTKATLSQETKDALKDARNEHKEVISAIKEEYKGMLKDESMRLEKKEKLEKLGNDLAEKLIDIAGDNSELASLVQKRHDVFKANVLLRKANSEAREKFRGERTDIVDKYKTVFVDRLETRIEKMPDDKLEKVLVKVEKLIEKYENNKRLSDERKDALVSQLIALKEIIEDRLDNVEDMGDIVDDLD